MASYMQMGHHSENLIGEKDLDEFSGLILSPVNRGPDDLRNDIVDYRGKGTYNIIFDPQLYQPKSTRRLLREQPYFPNDIDTADTFSAKWWENINTNLAKYIKDLKVDMAVSPAIIPNDWSNSYFQICVENSKMLSSELSDSNTKILTPVIVNFNLLNNKDAVLNISSIISGYKSDGFYIVVVSERAPRYELIDPDCIFGLMSLIRELKSTGLSVFVSHCSSDMILFKAAGADIVATGKFFNLRRFTKSRFDTPAEGGGQLPYYFSHGLLTFIKSDDLVQLIGDGYNDFIEVGFSNNYWANEILDQIRSEPEQPWLANSWRQYLSWFGKTEMFLSENNTQKTVISWLEEADKRWKKLDEDEFLLFERSNDGAWIRHWMRAMKKFANS